MRAMSDESSSRIERWADKLFFFQVNQLFKEANDIYSDERVL
jgi:hypothetical protein